MRPGDPAGLFLLAGISSAALLVALDELGGVVPRGTLEKLIRRADPRKKDGPAATPIAPGLSGWRLSERCDKTGAADSTSAPASPQTSTETPARRITAGAVVRPATVGCAKAETRGEPGNAARIVLDPNGSEPARQRGFSIKSGFLRLPKLSKPANNKQPGETNG